MTTFDELVEEVLLNLEGFTGDTGSVIGRLAGPISQFSTSLSVDMPPADAGGSPMSAGMVEVGSELMNALEFDRKTGVFTSLVRGWRGSRPSDHTTGEVVRSNPRYPKFQVMRAVNDAARALYPRISATQEVQLRATGNRTRYPLPDGTVAVHRVSFEEYGGSRSWPDVRAFRFVQQPAGEFAALGAAIEVHDIPVGRRFQVVVFREPGTMANLDDTLEVTAGLGAYTRPAVVSGAVMRLFQTVELGRALQTTVSQQMLNTQTPVGSATRLVSVLSNAYAMELAAAANKFDALFPPTRYRTW